MTTKKNKKDGPREREYMIKTMLRIADPILDALSKNELKKRMPVERSPDMAGGGRIPTTTYLEAFGRTMAGIAPWLELGADETEEGNLRAKYIDLALLCIKNGVNISSPDYLRFNYTEIGQALVDTAYLAQAMLRAPTQLLAKMDDELKNSFVEALKLTRRIKPVENNWVLFPGVVECVILLITGECDQTKIDYGLQRLKEWYRGDGFYSDGPDFHLDYYNSYDIHTMILDILKVMKSKGIPTVIDYETALYRHRRYAVILERMISPEGTYPLVGRSLVYRFGAFQSLSQISLMKLLPSYISPQQVRSALYHVVKRQVECPGTFDENGFLQIGIYGHQPDLGDYYISTGSLYMCCQVFLFLGLPPSDPLWNGPDVDWTTKRIVKGEIDVKKDWFDIV